MVEYIFYTTEGRTQAPNGKEIENSQVLGIVSGNSQKEAKENLLKENPLDNGFWLQPNKNPLPKTCTITISSFIRGDFLL